MRLIKMIQDAQLSKDASKIEKREAVRAILTDDNGLIPILFVSKYNYHKLPGGGVDAGEDKHEALVRECLEEVGCEIEIEGDVGQVIEYRAEWDFLQTSFCYSGKVLKKGTPNYTEKELSEGFELRWMDLDTAIETIRTDSPTNYAGEFIQKRDLEFLLAFRDM